MLTISTSQYRGWYAAEIAKHNELLGVGPELTQDERQRLDGYLGRVHAQVGRDVPDDEPIEITAWVAVDRHFYHHDTLIARAEGGLSLLRIAFLRELETLLPIWEQAFPGDDRPRLAIDAAREWALHPSPETQRAMRAASEAAQDAERDAIAAQRGRPFDPNAWHVRTPAVRAGSLGSGRWPSLSCWESAAFFRAHFGMESDYLAAIRAAWERLFAAAAAA